MLNEARLEVDCRHGCPSAIRRDDVPSDAYSVAYRGAVYRFLLEISLRPLVSSRFNEDDRNDFNLSLNVLDRYLTCLEEHLEAGDDTDYADKAAVDQLAARASEACKPIRVASLRAVAFEGPDFVSTKKDRTSFRRTGWRTWRSPRETFP
ncbi:MAG TPA: hypothetical protein VI168_02085 [Croceibacterium sp.]